MRLSDNLAISVARCSSGDTVYGVEAAARNGTSCVVARVRGRIVEQPPTRNNGDASRCERYSQNVDASRPLRIAVVNDYELVVLGVASALSAYADRVEVVELDSQVPLLSSVDVLLYDTFGQVQGDVMDLPELGAESSNRVVVFSWNTDPALVDRALRNGADGYLSKALNAGELVERIERVHRGEVVTPENTPVSFDVEFGRWPGDHHGLSPRESEILGLITQGLSNDEVAERAFVSKNTVKFHVRSIYAKIGVTRRSRAIAWALSHAMAPYQRRTMGSEIQQRAKDVLGEVVD